jgi:hypothetical protein
MAVAGAESKVEMGDCDGVVRPAAAKRDANCEVEVEEVLCWSEGLIGCWNDS